MIKVNYDSTTGKILGLYPDDIIYTSIPEPYIEIDDTSHHACVDNAGLRIVDTTNLCIISLSSVLCYYDYGLLYKTTTSNYTVSSGEVLFTSTPTESELVSAFPSTAGSIVYTITTAPVTGDTITIEGVTLTSPTGASDISSSLNANSSFSAYYTASYSDDTITITEKIPGNQNTPSAATYTGTVVISSGTPVSSVYGYKTALINQKITSLTSVYTTEMEQIIRGYNVANLSGTSATSYKTALANLKSWLDTETEAIING